MANTAVTPVKLTDVNVISGALTYSSVSATTDFFVIDFTPSSDNKMIIEFNASANDTATVYAGNGVAGQNDLTLTIPSGFTRLQVDSSAFMNVSGTNKDKVVVKVNKTTTTLAALALR